MQFRILGPLEVCDERGPLTLGGLKQRALLAVLLLHANEPVSAERLAFALWGEDASHKAIKTVQVHLSRLRRTLGDRAVVATTSAGYCLHVGSDELDAERFERLVGAGRSALADGKPEHAAELLRDALALWRGSPLADLAFEPALAAEAPQIARLEDQRLAALEERIEADLAVGRHADVVGECQHLMTEHPRRERLACHLMLALYRCGRQTEALEVYGGVRRGLVDDVGIEPGPELRRLQAAILRQDAALVPWVAALPDASAAWLFPLPGAVQQSGDPGPIVGRAAALDQLGQALGRAASGARQLVMVRGEPGVGKTRLATDFARSARADGALVLYGRCDEESLLPHQPFVEALRHYVRNCPAALLADQVQPLSGELRRVVPELAERVPKLDQPLPDPEGARYRLFEAVAALLCEAAQRQPVVLVLDDLHWADSATMLLLKYVARYPRDAKLMVVGTYRDADIAANHALQNLLADLTREELVERLALGRLDEAAVSELVGWHTGNRAPADLQRMVFEETDGLAFFVVEFARHLAESKLTDGAGDDGQQPAERRLPLPEGVVDLISSRLSHLGPECNRVLETASVIGPEFAFEMLERICDLSQDDLVDALDSAVRAQLIQEPARGGGRYRCSHALIRDVLYGRLTVARRCVLHRRVAAAIEQAHGSDLQPHFAELAHHLEQAGAGEDLDKATAYAALAGDRALAMLAYEQAAALYRQAVALHDERKGPDWRVRRCELTIAQGEAERMAGDPSHRETLLRAAARAEEMGDVALLARAALANNRGFNSSSQGVDRDRVAVLRAALTALEDVDSAMRAELLAQLAVELIADTDWRGRARLAEQALAMARRAGDPSTLARVLTQHVVAGFSPSTLVTRAAHVREASRLATAAGELSLASQAAKFGFNTALETGDVARARQLLDELGTLAKQLGQPMIDWYHAGALATLETVTASPKEAEARALAAYEIAQRAGQPDALMFFVGHLYAARLLSGTLDEGEPNLPTLFDPPGSGPVAGPEFTPSRSLRLLIGAAMSVVLCEVGRPEHGRRHFDLLMDEVTRDPPNDYSTLVTLASAAMACAHLRDAGRAPQLHDLLSPFAAQFVTTGATGAIWLGSVRHHLAGLSATMGKAGDADGHFAEAARAYEVMGATGWLIRCRLDWASTLLHRGAGGDAEHACALIARASAAARALGLGAVEARAAVLARRAEPASSRSDGR